MDMQVLFGIDMETDVGSFTPFYEGVRTATPMLLELFAKKGVKATFYFTGHAARSNPEPVNLVSETDHEVGCHSLFHETVGDELFSIPA
jgi:peptidoglycan/xylan/chitin deacetylase (PgdA/CDA1 family)